MSKVDEREFIMVNGGYIAFIFLLSVLSFANAFLLLIVKLPESVRLILIINYGISAVLLLDFIYAAVKSRFSRDYLVGWYGWMALLGSLPIPGISIFRVVRIALLGRKLRRSGLSAASRLALEQRGRSAFLTTIFLAVLALELAGLLMLRAESGAPNSQINTAQDALWWGYVTMSTVGYGDLVPVTGDGRAIGLVMVTVGVALFSVTTGFLTDWFRRDRREPRRFAVKESEMTADDPRRQFLEIARLLDEQDQAHKAAIAALRERLRELEKHIER